MDDVEVLFFASDDVFDLGRGVLWVDYCGAVWRGAEREMEMEWGIDWGGREEGVLDGSGR